ncbi:MAG: DUF2179 domain-containing protein [Spirochaetes bacterium]|nr:MAG: DUF2179 domain-containing protein [Spirochaetota bacterium]
MDLSRFMPPEIAGMLLIFLARIMDVSIGTIRIILVSRGYRTLAPLFGFVEVLIWLAAIREVMFGLHGVASYLVYAAGFATGNYAGMWLESKIAIGTQAIRIITTEKMLTLPVVLRQEGFGVTTIKGRGAKGEVTIIYTIVPRKKARKVFETVEALEPGAFISVEDIKSRARGFFGERRGFASVFGSLIEKKK